MKNYRFVDITGAIVEQGLSFTAELLPHTLHYLLKIIIYN